MQTRADRLGVRLRPQLKTAKSREVARLGGFDRITVSTLAEAEYFFSAGFTDILYGVGVSAQKLERVSRLRAAGCDLQVVIDSVEMASVISGWETDLGVWIEIDSDGTRAGMAPRHPDLLQVARLIATRHRLRGVMTHAGGSYAATGPEQLGEWAERERDAVVVAAHLLRQAGFETPEVSVGSTPTATHAVDLTGVTEMRPGVYMFGDVHQAHLGTCAIDDIAISVLSTVIGRRPDGWLIDAGSLALSLDRSMPGLGRVADLDARPIAELVVDRVSQEHGVIIDPDRRLTIGERVRILPNHACITAACHHEYQVVEGRTVTDRWERCGGW